INDGDGVFAFESTLVSDNGDLVRVGDLDKDGDLDFIVGDESFDSENSIYLNDGTGSFSLMEDSPLDGVIAETHDIDIADFNGDTYLDFIVYNNLSDNYLYLNNKDGTFTGSVVISDETTTASQQLVVGDFDNDGDLDLQGYIYFYLNDGLGNFTTDDRQTLSSIDMESVETGDFDGDGDEDLLVFDSANDEIYIYANDGTGYFDQSLNAVYSFDGDVSVTSADVGDYNGDGVLDFHIPASADAFIALNTTDVQFVEATWAPTYYVVSIFDANNDGYQDLWQVGGGTNSRVLLMNQGDGSYTEVEIAETEGMSGIVYKAEAVDVNGDGYLDIVEAVYQGANNLYLNDGADNFTFVADAFSDETNHTVYMRTGDIDNDGDYDVMFLNSGFEEAETYFERWENDGTGNFNKTFGASPLAGTTVNTYSFDLGDVDGDGNIDFVIPLGEGDENPMYVYFGAGDGTFDGATIDGSYESMHDATLGDYDNDGDLDIFGDGQFFVNDGTGQFIVSINYSSIGLGPAESLDIDNDGDLDIIFITEAGEGTRNSILRNQGNWSFVEEQGMFSAEDPTLTIVYGDYDSDGDMDFFIKNAEYFEASKTSFFYRDC
ncbi:MAG: hypothetical protein UT02_C0053G0001, partial [Parcubacteria group bacterium GW2011_GWC2_38_7]